MRVILTDSSFIASLALGLVVLVVSPFVAFRFRRSEIIAVVGVAAGYWVARPDLGPYLDPTERIDSWMRVLAALAVVAVAATAAWSSRRTGSGSSLTIAITLATVGVFLCVPETGVLRFVVPPAILVGPAVWLGLIRPLAPWAVVLIGGGVAWLSVVDGHTRGSAVVGAAACLATVALVPLIERTAASEEESAASGKGGPARHDQVGIAVAEHPVLVGQAVLGLAVIGCARWAGLQQSTTVAVVQAGLVLAGAAALLLWLQRVTSRTPRATRV